MKGGEKMTGCFLLLLTVSCFLTGNWWMGFVMLILYSLVTKGDGKNPPEKSKK